MELFGWKSSSLVENGDTLTCSVSVSVNNSTPVSTGSNVIYDKTKTFIIQSITPNYGNISGNTDVTITLDKDVGTAIPSVLIDGITCLNPTANVNIITCKTDAKTFTARSSLVVLLDSY